MDRSNLEKYYSSVAQIDLLKNQGIISEKEYAKAESFLAKKYCIKIGNLYRSINLLLPTFRGNMNVQKKEAVNGNENNENRCVTKISKEN